MERCGKVAALSGCVDLNIFPPCLTIALMPVAAHSGCVDLNLHKFAQKFKGAGRSPLGLRGFKYARTFTANVVPDSRSPLGLRGFK